VKVAVVSGASRGIGRATALELARRGLGIAVVGRASAEQDATLELCRAAGAPDARAFACDLADAAATERALNELLAVFPAPDVLVNNAGTAPRVSLEDTRTELWDEALAVNLRAPFLLARAVVPSMRRRGQGRIVFVGSISSTLGSPRLAAYTAAKWGVVGLMKSLAADLTDSGVVCLAVLPGSTATRMLEGSGFPPRMTAEDVAKTIVHYALDAPAAHAGAALEMFGV
jgi:NAD(P)-dependent dehydrogenase (short-subunit alcohol dehydrogenase family)